MTDHQESGNTDSLNILTKFTLTLLSEPSTAWALTAADCQRSALLREILKDDCRHTEVYAPFDDESISTWLAPKDSADLSSTALLGAVKVCMVLVCSFRARACPRPVHSVIQDTASHGLQMADCAHDVGIMQQCTACSLLHI